MSVSIVDFAQAETLAMITLLRTYIDEFGDYNDTSCATFGMIGMVGAVHSWHKLQPKWEDALECCGVTRFHGTDLENYQEDYEGWTRSQRERLLSLLIRVVQEDIDNFRMIGCVTIMADYRRLPNYRKERTKNPYYMSAVIAMQQALFKATEDFASKPIEFIFDQRHKQVKLLNDAYDEVSKASSSGHLCTALSRANHRTVTLLQVADLFAYEAKKHIDGTLAGKTPVDVRWPVKQLDTIFSRPGKSLLDQHGLMLITDYWGNYERSYDQLHPYEVHND